MARNMEHMQLLMALSLYIQSHENNPKSTVLVPATPEMLFGPDYQQHNDESSSNNSPKLGEADHDYDYEYDYEYSSAEDDDEDLHEHDDNRVDDDMTHGDHRHSATDGSLITSNTKSACKSKSTSKGSSTSHWHAQDRIVELEDHECETSIDG